MSYRGVPYFFEVGSQTFRNDYKISRSQPQNSTLMASKTALPYLSKMASNQCIVGRDHKKTQKFSAVMSSEISTSTIQISTSILPKQWGVCLIAYIHIIMIQNLTSGENRKSMK